MASLNLSANGQSISASYQKIVNSPPPSGAAANSPTYGQWAVFAVQAPLANAFQPDPSKESVLKVQDTGEGELIDMVEDFSDGKIQFAFVKVKDTNSGLPKNVLVCWCGEGVPERTKGYFTSHMNAVSKLLHGYHVQITARSEQDLTPEGIVQKVADSSGSKYGGGSAGGAAPSSGPRPPVASKPSMPTKSFGTAGSFQPLGGRSRAPAPAGKVDEDGWGEDAPQVTRSQLEKVGSAYQPTKVDMASLQRGPDASRSKGNDAAPSDPNVVKGGYQPIGKVDIAAIRQQAQSTSDDRPTTVKGAYQPVGKVDIAEIRRKAQGSDAPSQPSPTPAPAAEEDERPKSLADRSAAFTSSERMTSMPKPKVSNRFGADTSSFAGTKAPVPGGFESKPIASAAPIGAAGRTFADSAGKTPAQQWAERKARERGNSGAAADTISPAPTGGAAASPIQNQQSGGGGWQSGYAGKKWGVQIPTRTGGSGISEQKTGQDEPAQQQEDEAPSGGIGSIRDRFKEVAPMGAAREPPSAPEPSAPQPPPLDNASKPNAGGPRGVPIPGMPPPPPQPQPEDDEEDDLPPPPPRPQFEGHPTQEHVNMPPPPPRPMPADEESDDDGDMPQGQGSPIPIARPVARGASPEPIEKMESRSPPPSMPVDSIAQAAAQTQFTEPEPQVEEDEPARSAGQTAAAATFGSAEDPHAGAANSGGHEAVAQYDYEKAEDNELELREGERVFNIDMVDEDWWMGENSRGEKGLFPSNYVELVEGGGVSAGGAAAPPSPPTPEPVQETPAPPMPASAPAAGGKTATAQYDYQAAEDNELSFPDGAKITGIEFPDDDWWFGHYGGKEGLFPANYVELD